MKMTWMLVLGVAVVACGKKEGGRSINGKVIDSFGKPVGGATIAPDKGAKATAGADGAFKLSFSGATPKLVVSMPGYQQVEVAMAGPTPTVTLIQAPPKDGVFLVEAAGYKELALVKLESPSPGMYKVPADAFTKLASGSKLAFKGMKPDDNRSLGWKRMEVGQGDTVSFGPGVSFDLRSRAIDLTGGDVMFVEEFHDAKKLKWAIGKFTRGPNGENLLENDQALLVTTE
jgi:hypothetical protein